MSFAKSRMLKLKQNAHPPSFVCPLSYAVMEEPVSDLCAHTFERSAIEAWLDRGNTCCPISRKALSREDLKPNHELAERIEKWKWEKEHEDVMILKATTPPSSEFDADDDDDEFSNEGHVERSDDIEMGKCTLNPGFKKKLYQEVPTGMTLLPQEREALERIRTRNKSIREQRRRQRCCFCAVAVVAVILLAGFVGAYVFKRHIQEENFDREYEVTP